MNTSFRVKLKVVCCALATLVLTGCILTPTGLEKEDVSLFSLQQLAAQNQACQCKTTQQMARWGGKILSATALADKMKLEILSMPVLPITAQPNLQVKPDGRFIAYLPQFIDPEILKDQYITVKGILTGYQQGKIDLHDYEYPMVQGQHYQLWHLVAEEYYDADEMADWRKERAKGFLFWKPDPKVRFKLAKYE